MEQCFTCAGRAISAARGIFRFAVLGAALFAVLAAVSLQSIGSGFVVFGLLALYFTGLAFWQGRLARNLARTVILVDDDGILVSTADGERLHPADSVCVRHGCLPRSAGIGKRVQVCQAVLVCRTDMIVDIESRASAIRSGLPALQGRTIPVDAETYARFIAVLGERGWDRPCSEEVPAEAGRTGTSRTVRIMYALGIVLCLVAWITLDNGRLGIAFLIGGLGLTGLLLNSLYARTGLPRSDEGADRAD